MGAVEDPYSKKLSLGVWGTLCRHGVCGMLGGAMGVCGTLRTSSKAGDDGQMKCEFSKLIMPPCSTLCLLPQVPLPCSRGLQGVQGCKEWWARIFPGFHKGSKTGLIASKKNVGLNAGPFFFNPREKPKSLSSHVEISLPLWSSSVDRGREISSLKRCNASW